MAGRCRWWRHCRLQSPSKIANRNRNVLYVILFLPLLLTFLLIPGGEIANFKYSGDSSGAAFITTFVVDGDNSHLRHQGGGGGGGDDIIREPRSLADGGDKVVVLWHSFFEFPTWKVSGDPFRECEESRCKLSTDRGRVAQADAVLFDARGLYTNPRLPAEHPPWQVWILHNSEPPYNIYEDLSQYNNVFNWTSWYRTDADIFAPYGYFVDKASDDDEFEEVRGGGDDDGGDDKIEKQDNSTTTANTTTSTSQKAATPDFYRQHDRVLYFAASNCRDRGRRYKRVGQLRNYLPIDTFGDCGKYQCPKGHAADCDAVFKRYQFVLAFENGYCRDYVTEKLWEAYRRQQIPIVSGGADYERFAIPGSYIDYDNFSSVEELASFVHKVSTNPDLYNSFFAWRQKFEAFTAPVTDWCSLCRALHDKGRPPQTYKNLAGWVAMDSCPLYSEYAYIWTQIYLGLYKLFGI